MKRIISFILMLCMVGSCVNVSAENVSDNAAENEVVVKEKGINKLSQAEFKLGEGFTSAVYGNYAYVAAKNGGIQVIDLTNPQEAKTVTPSNKNLQGAAVNDGSDCVAVNGKYLYAAFTADADGNNAMEIRQYSLEKPAFPSFQKSYKVESAVRDIEFKDKHMFVADNTSGIKVYDLSSGKTDFSTRYSLETCSGVMSMCISGDYLYAAYTNPGEIRVYDISDPKVVKKVSTVSVEGYFLEIVKTDNALYVSDVSNKRILMIEGEDPIKLKNATVYQCTGEGEQLSVVGMVAEGNTLYVGEYASPSHLYAFDVSNPHEMKLLAKEQVDIAPYYFAKTGNTIVVPARDKGVALYSVGEFDEGKTVNVVPLKEKTEVEEEKPQTPTEAAMYEDIVGHWAKNDIEDLTKKGILKGDGTGKFRPDDTVTRAEFIAMVARAVSLNLIQYNGAYSDVSESAWYASVVQAASNVGMIDANLTKNNKLQPQTAILREEAATIIVNAVYLRNPSWFEATTLMKFADESEISSWAYEAVAGAYSRGIFIGNTNNEIQPKKSLTRAEAAAVIKRATKNFKAGSAQITVSDAHINTEEVVPQMEETPMMFKVTDAVSPDELFTVFGANLHADSLEIAVVEVKNDTPDEVPPSNATKLEIIQTDVQGNFAVTRLPKQAKNGSYYLWAKNSEGWGRPIVLNKARTLWISENIMTAGNVIKVVGRNFDRREFGADLKTRVVLKNETSAYDAIIVNEVNPFGIDFTVGNDVPDGEYTIYVSNDGIIWDEVNSGQTLNIVSDVEDPYELGVGWAGVFNWDNVIDVRAYGATPNDDTDDNEAIQNALNAVAESGGGVAYFPKGVYKFYQLILPAGVLCVGDSMGESIMMFSTPDSVTDEMLKGWIAVSSDYAQHGNVSEGKQGFINISIHADPDQKEKRLPNAFAWLGDGWFPDDRHQRKANYIVYKNFGIETRYEYIDVQEAGGSLVVTTGNEHLLIDGCEFNGLSCTFSSGYFGAYASVRNCKFDTVGKALYYQVMYYVVENNVFTRRVDPDITSNGMFARSNSYVANNIFNGAGSNTNDGEIISVEPFRGGTKMLGKVVSATADTITVEPERDSTGMIYGENQRTNNFRLDGEAYGDWEIVIIDGRGLGQARKLIDSDEETNTFTIEKNWDILPDSTSRFAVSLLLKNVTFYNNTAEYSQNTMQLYGDTYDAVMINNTHNPRNGDFASDGFYVHTIEKRDSSNTRQQSAYFTRIENNVVDGVGWKNHTNSIAVVANCEITEGFDSYGYLVYGCDIKNNKLIGRKEYEQKAISNWYYNGIWIGTYSRYIEAMRPTIAAVTIEGNHVENSDRGISIGGGGLAAKNGNKAELASVKSSISGIVLRKNTFKDVDREIVDEHDAENVVYVND